MCCKPEVESTIKSIGKGICDSCLGDANHTASQTAASIASGLAKLVATLAQIIRISVDDEGTTQNRIGATQSELGILNVNSDIARCIGHNIAQIADVTLDIFRSTVSLAKWIEVGTGRCATIGVVTELVHFRYKNVTHLKQNTLKPTVESVLSRSKSTNSACYFDWSIILETNKVVTDCFPK